MMPLAFAPLDDDYLFEEDEIRERMARQYEEDDEYELDDE